MKKAETIYILATGAQDAERLHILNQVYGSASEAALLRAGLGQGMRVAEVGCGSGNMTCWIARQVGAQGAVVGVDKSPAQIELARRQASEAGLRNVTFTVGDVYSTGLPPGSFDLAYCRFILIHLRRPAEALSAMRDLVRLGGCVVCEELDLSHWLCEPPESCMEQFIRLNLALGDRRGEDFRLGRRLPALFRQAGFAAPMVSGHFPLVLRGQEKQLLWRTFVEFAPALVEEGLATKEEIDKLEGDMRRVAHDDTTLLGSPLMVQTWAVK